MVSPTTRPFGPTSARDHFQAAEEMKSIRDARSLSTFPACESFRFLFIDGDINFICIPVPCIFYKKHNCGFQSAMPGVPYLLCVSVWKNKNLKKNVLATVIFLIYYAACRNQIFPNPLSSATVGFLQFVDESRLAGTSLAILFWRLARFR